MFWTSTMLNALYLIIYLFIVDQSESPDIFPKKISPKLFDYVVYHNKKDQCMSPFGVSDHYLNTFLYQEKSTV